MGFSGLSLVVCVAGPRICYGAVYQQGIWQFLASALNEPCCLSIVAVLFPARDSPRRLVSREDLRPGLFISTNQQGRPERRGRA